MSFVGQDVSVLSSWRSERDLKRVTRIGRATSFNPVSLGFIALTDNTLWPDGRLNIDRTQSEGRVELRLAGELDLATASDLDVQLAALDRLEPAHILIDLGAVEFMDSTGLASIVRAHLAAQANGHTLAFRRGPAQVQRLLSLTGVDERLTFED